MLLSETAMSTSHTARILSFLFSEPVEGAICRGFVNAASGGIAATGGPRRDSLREATLLQRHREDTPHQRLFVNRACPRDVRPKERFAVKDPIMLTTETAHILARLFSELVDGANDPAGAFMLNSGDVGLLRSLDRLSAAAASRSAGCGATIAAHAQHLRYGLSLMNRWADEGGNPFADARWEAPWKTSAVSEREWEEIRGGLRDEAQRWIQALGSPRDARDVELAGMVSSIAHLAYHLGAIRQIDKDAREPKEGTFQ